jgi:phenylalanyl-tRNA synthetase alpha chain
MGAGMVHPKVLENSGLDPKKYQGFAFGGGIDRIAMLKWAFDDIRMLYNGDLRVVNQF